MTNESGCGSGRPRKIPDPDPQHCYLRSFTIKLIGSTGKKDFWKTDTGATDWLIVSDIRNWSYLLSLKTCWLELSWPWLCRACWQISWSGGSPWRGSCTHPDPAHGHVINLMSWAYGCHFFQELSFPLHGRSVPADQAFNNTVRIRQFIGIFIKKWKNTKINVPKHE